MNSPPADNDPTEIRRRIPSADVKQGEPSGIRGVGGTQALPAGAKVSEFEIIKPIGEGGFSIVYLAWDPALERQIAIKEYMPQSMAARTPSDQVTVRSQRDQESFQIGLTSFVKEGRLLAHFQHPSLVKVLSFWEANGTAYMAMPFYEGPTLAATLKDMPGPPDEPWLRGLLVPLIDALKALHADNCYHRDIAPDNILLLGSHTRPLLLDFGAARRVIGEATHALTVILKPGYAPIEQYDEAPSMKQGPWTDVYALCAVLYRAIAGHPPIPAVSRALKDGLVPISKLAAGKYSPSFLAAIDAGLAVRPEDRPRDLEVLSSKLLSPQKIAVKGSKHRDLARWSVGSGVMVVGLVAGWFVIGAVLEPDKSVAPAVPPVLQTPPVASTSSPQPIAEEPASPPVPPLPRPEITQATEFSLNAVLDDIAARASPDIAVTVDAVKPQVVIGKDEVRLRVKSSEAGYLYVLYMGTGPAGLAMVFPNSVDRDNRIDANRELVVPRKVVLKANGPPGEDHVLAIVSPVPREFLGLAGPAGRNAQGPISQFDLAALQAAWPSRQNETSTYAGVPRCDLSGACPSQFGASTLVVTEVAPAK